MLLSLPDETAEQVLGWLLQRDERGGNYIAALIQRQLQEKAEVEKALKENDSAALFALSQHLGPGYQRFRVLTWLYGHANEAEYATEKLDRHSRLPAGEKEAKESGQ